MDQVEKRLLGKRILSKKPIRTNYFDFNANDLPKEFLLWIDNVIEKGEKLVRYGSESKYEYRAKIFDEIIFICIRELLPWTKLNNAKIALLNLASMAGGKLLPSELMEFKEKYNVLKGLNALNPYIDNELISDIKSALDIDLISKAKSTGYLNEMEERLKIFYKGHRQVFLKTRGRSYIPFLNAILFKCYCAFDGLLDGVTYGRIAQFVNVIFLDDIVGGKEPGNLINLRIVSILKPGKNETKEQKISKLEQKWRKISKMSKEDLEKLKYGFRAFFQDHGYYPTSDLDSKPKDIIIPTDWNKYQFPSHEIMWKYVKRWPLHDPTFDVKKPAKSNQYLYRLTDDGKHFAVYARLGNASDKEAKDYNKLDKIDSKLGVFNYKVSF